MILLTTRQKLIKGNVSKRECRECELNNSKNSSNFTNDTRRRYEFKKDERRAFNEHKENPSPWAVPRGGFSRIA